MRRRWVNGADSQNSAVAPVERGLARFDGLTGVAACPESGLPDLALVDGRQRDRREAAVARVVPYRRSGMAPGQS
jgi:hypothetical protein